MPITPTQFLLLLVLATVGAAAGRSIVRRRHVGRLRALARELRMHYSASDPFRLSARLTSKLPTPGAAGIRVLDLIYGIEGESYRYVFATEYTTGVLRTKTSVRRIATFSELRAPGVKGTAAPDLVLAPQTLPVVEQYRHLLTQSAAPERQPARA